MRLEFCMFGMRSYYLLLKKRKSFMTKHNREKVIVFLFSLENVTNPPLNDIGSCRDHQWLAIKFVTDRSNHVNHPRWKWSKSILWTSNERFRDVVAFSFGGCHPFQPTGAVVYTDGISAKRLNFPNKLAELAVVVEYTNCISAEE